MSTIDGRWQLGIGDPTVGGWLTVAAYGLAAWACWRAGQTQQQRAGTANLSRFWWLTALAMGLLGLNKQLDQQSALTQFGRDLALHDGWYAQRRAVQLAFVAAVGLAGSLALALMLRLAWPLSRGRALALGGIAFVLAFVAIRAASFHAVDGLLTQTALGLRWNWIFELSGIALVAGGALREHRLFGKAARQGFTQASRPVPRPAAPAPQPPPAAPRPRRRAPPGDDRPVISPGDPRSRPGA